MSILWPGRFVHFFDASAPFVAVNLLYQVATTVVLPRTAPKACARLQPACPQFVFA
jgi:hypothetical protein